MEVCLRAGTRTLQLRLVAAGDGFAATLDGGTHRVACLAVGPRNVVAGGATVDELVLDVDGRRCHVVVARSADRVLVALAGRVHAFEIGHEARGRHDGGARSGAVTAPMPGKVLAVLVAPGDAVEVGQPLVVVEAMKMETTLAAEAAGTVSAVRAAPGALVDAGDLLVEIAVAPAE